MTESCPMQQKKNENITVKISHGFCTGITGFLNKIKFGLRVLHMV